MRNYLLKSCLCALLAVAILLPSLPVIAPSSVASAEGESIHGDVTGDGIIDGRDALKIMRFVQGFETATADDIARGDVYPVPGTDGRVNGDGQLTVEDASWILKYTVGLVTEGEVTGDFSNSVPVIYSLSPSHGYPGTIVTILGENFVGSSPNENLVYFGDIEAQVLSSTSTEIVVEVPPDAESSLVNLVTPAGKTTSPFDFTITCLRDGLLVVPAGMTPDDYDLVNKFGDTAEPWPDGSYLTSTDIHGVTLHYAVPKDDSDRILFSFDLTDGSPPPSATINFISTAEAMVFMSPYFSTMNPERAQQMMPYIQDDSKVIEFAGVLETLYADVEEPFEDPRFEDAYTAAIESVISRMPDGLLAELEPVESINTAYEVLQENTIDPDMASIPSATEYSPLPSEQEVPFLEMEEEQDPKVKKWQEETLGVYYPDSVLTGVGKSTKIGGIKPDIMVSGILDGWSPVDWLVDFVEVNDPYSSFAEGEASITAMDPSRVINRGVDRQLTFISSNSYTKYIDVFGRLFEGLWELAAWAVNEVSEELGWGSTEGAASPDGDLHVPLDTDSVYIARNFSGVIGFGDYSNEGDFAWNLPEGDRDYWIAIAFNAAMAAIDAASIYLDVKTAGEGKEGGLKLRNVITKAIKKGVKLALKKIPKSAGGASRTEVCKTVLSIINGIAMDILCVLAGDVSEALLEKCSYKIFKFIGKSIDPLYKISVGSAAVERALALVSFSSLASPLETWVITSGKPFTLVITSLSSTVGPPGEEVVITGKNFDYRDKGFNQVRLGLYWQEATPLEVISVDDRGEELRVRIPEGAKPGEQLIRIKTPYSPGSVDTGVTYTVKRIPKLYEVTPQAGFAKTGVLAGNPFSNYPGDPITFKGVGFGALDGESEDKIMFGATETTAYVGSATSTEMTWRVPALTPMLCEVYIDCVQWSVYSERHTFKVLSAPVLTSVDPLEVMIGQAVTLTGIDFGYSTETVKVDINGNISARILSVNNESLVFQMPSVGDPGEELSVKVYTPGGTSGELSFMRLPGIVVPDTPSYSSGFSIEVNSFSIEDNGPGGLVTVDDAAAISRGEVNPFTTPGWDDRDEVYTIHRFQDKTCEGDDCTYTWREEPAIGPEYSVNATKNHEYKFTYWINHYHDDYGGEVSNPILQNDLTVDLDETPEQMEEGDYVNYLYDIQSGGAGYKDTIYLETSGTYTGTNVAIGDSDRIYMAPDVTSLMPGPAGITVGNGCTLELATLDGGGVTINGNANRIERANIINVNGNGITINEGIGLYTPPYGDYRITISSCSGHGIYVNGGGKQSIYAQISGAGGHGIYVKGGEEIDLTGNISGCNGSGIYLEGGRENDISGRITGCDYGVKVVNAYSSQIGVSVYGSIQTGIYIEGGEAHKLENCWLEGNNLDGLGLVYTKLLTAANSYSLNNYGDGINIDDYCTNNIFTNFDTFGNENGIYIRGSNTHSNTFQHYMGIGVGGSCFDENPGDGAYFTGNRKNGVYISGGAHDNCFSDVDIYGSGEYGVLIADEGSDWNEFHDSCIGMEADYDAPPNSYLTGNTLGGVMIRGGAKSNYFECCDIGRSNGNGVTITNTGTTHNMFEDCKIGCMLGDDDNAGSPWKNVGFGVLINDGAYYNEVVHCMIGINIAGGVKVQGISRNWGVDETPRHLAVIAKNYIGYGYIGSYWDTNNVLSGTSGDGIHLESCTDIMVDGNWVRSHNTGIHISGAGSSANTMTNGYVRSAFGPGILIENSSNDYVYSLTCSQNNGHGIQLVNTSDVMIETAGFDNNGGDGINLFEADGTVIKAKKFDGWYESCISQYNTGNGLHVNQSDNVMVYLAAFTNNGGHGVLVDGDSVNVELSVPDIECNGLSGLYIGPSDNVRTYPDKEDTLMICNNAEYGVVIEDATNVQIGQANCYFSNITGNGLSGILVQGDQTNHVRVHGINQIASDDFEAVTITGGSDVIIGGKSSGEGNSIEMSPVGILVTGDASGVSIYNNNIGEPPEFESGTKEFGNAVGIKIDGTVQDTAIEWNVINCNRREGIYLTGGATGTFIKGNIITENGRDGVLVEGPTTISNVITENSITWNAWDGICLSNGGNGEIEAPVITNVTWRGYTISGTVTAPRDSIVEAYADDDDEGDTYLGTSRIFGNCFYINANVANGRKFHAIVIHPNGNTSAFGECQVPDTGPGGNVVFTSTRDGNEEIYLLVPGHTLQDRLTANSVPDSDPQLSSDGKYIVFTSERDGNPDLWFMEQDGNNQASLYAGPSADYEPAWSFDDTKLAFVSEQDGNPEIYTMDILPGAPAGTVWYYNSGYANRTATASSENDTDAMLFTTQPGLLTDIQFYIQENPSTLKWVVLNVEDNRPGTQVLAEGTSEATATGWHTVDIPDIEIGSEFVVGLIYDENLHPGLGEDYAWWNPSYRSWKYDTAGDSWQMYSGFFMIKATVEVNPQRVTFDRAANRQPAWNKDGTKIAFTSSRAGNDDIWVIDADGANLQQVTTDDAADYHPAWWPHGDKIIFVSERDGNPEIYMADSNGGNLMRVTSDAAVDTDPSWNYNGNLILFSSDRHAGMELYTMNFDGSLPRRITTSLGDNTQSDGGRIPNIQYPQGSSYTENLLVVNPEDRIRMDFGVAEDVIEPVYQPLESVIPVQNNATAPYLVMESGNVTAAGTVNLTVWLYDAEVLGNLAFEVHYDSLAFRLTNISGGNVTDAYGSLYYTNPGEYPDYSGEIRFNWVCAGGFSGNGSVITLTFEVNEEAHWDDFDILLENMEAYDTALYLAGVTGIDGVLNVQGTYGDANHDGAINVLDMTRIARIILEMDDRTDGSDANRDELINVLDITKVARKILGLD